MVKNGIDFFGIEVFSQINIITNLGISDWIVPDLSRGGRGP